MHRRRRLIRSGHFGALRQSKSDKKEGLTTVRRTKTCDMSGESSMSILNLSYTIHRPDLIHSVEKKPLLVIHGGPSIPSNYLQPLSKNHQDRCIIFYDQVGCGNSSVPKDINYYSIQNTVTDLEHLIQHLKLREFHLYGHSFGGIVAYEYSKRKCEAQGADEEMFHPDSPKLASVTLCSTPSNLREVDEETKLLLETMETSRPRSNSQCSETSHMSIDGNSDEEALFQRTHVCRSSDGTLPLPLQEAYAKRGTVWEGTDVIIDYVAQPLKSEASALPPMLLLRGEYDFVSEIYGFDEWKKCINHESVVCQTLRECAHYSMLENAMLHSETLDTFLNGREKDSFASVEQAISQ